MNQIFKCQRIQHNYNPITHLCIKKECECLTTTCCELCIKEFHESQRDHLYKELIKVDDQEQMQQLDITALKHQLNQFESKLRKQLTELNNLLRKIDYLEQYKNNQTLQNLEILGLKFRQGNEFKQLSNVFSLGIKEIDKNLENMISKTKCEEIIVNSYDKVDELFDQKDYIKCINFLNQMLLFDSHNIKYLNLKALSLMNINKYEESIQISDSILGFQNNHMGAIYMKTLSLYQLNKDQEVIDFTDKYLQYLQDQSLSSFEILKIRVQSFLQLNQPQKSLDINEKILKYCPQDLKLLGCKAEALRLLDQQQNAIDLTNSILKIDQNNQYALAIQGSSLVEIDKKREGISYLKKALNIQKDYLFVSNFLDQIKSRIVLREIEY